MIICLKPISEKCFSLSVNVNTNLNLFWALGGLWVDNQAFGDSEGTQRALKGHLGT